MNLLARWLHKPKLSEVVETYLANHRCEPSTKTGTYRAFRYLAQAVGDIKVHRFGFAEAEKFQMWITKGRTDATLRMYIKTIRPVFNWCIKNGYCKKNAFRDLPLPPEPEIKVRVYEQHEFEALLQACPDLLWQAYLWAGKTAGLRRGEVLNLCVWDIDFERSIIRLTAKQETSRTWRWQPKNKMNNSELPLVPQLEELLAQILRRLPEGQPYLLLSPSRYQRNREMLTRDRLSNQMRVVPYPNFDRVFARIRAQAGIRYGTFHDLRRTYVTQLAEGGCMPHELSRLARHSDVNITMRYYVAERDSAVEKAKRIMNGTTGLGPAAPR